MIDGVEVGWGRPGDTALRSRTLASFVDRSLEGRLYAAEMKPVKATREYKIGAIVRDCVVNPCCVL